MNSIVDDDDTLPDPPRVQRAELPTPPTDSGGASSIGHRRARNEDRFGSHQSVFLVADGMGGHPGGEEAAIVACDHFLQQSSSIDAGAPLTAWVALISETSERVRSSTQELGFEHAGTTITAISVESNRVVLIHVGDSRGYMVFEDRLEMVSYDHNLAAEFDDLAEHISPEMTGGLPPEALTSYLGMKPGTLDAFVCELPRHAGRRMLLCTDGVYRQVSEDALVEVANQMGAQAAADELVRRSDAAGGIDNATALVVQL